MTLGELKIKPKKLPVLPWIEKNILIHLKKDPEKQIYLRVIYLFSSQFDELHQEFSIENRRQQSWNFSDKKIIKY